MRCRLVSGTVRALVTPTLGGDGPPYLKFNIFATSASQGPWFVKSLQNVRGKAKRFECVLGKRAGGGQCLHHRHHCFVRNVLDIFGQEGKERASSSHYYRCFVRNDASIDTTVVAMGREGKEKKLFHRSESTACASLRLHDLKTDET
jgi:hypothetical protein